MLSIIAAPITAVLIHDYLLHRGEEEIQDARASSNSSPCWLWPCPARYWAWATFAALRAACSAQAFLSGIYGTGLILIIVFIVRSLPAGTRSGISALRQIDKSIEESAYDMGAGSGKVFMTVTLPLIKDSFLSAAL